MGKFRLLFFQCAYQRGIRFPASVFAAEQDAGEGGVQLDHVETVWPFFVDDLVQPFFQRRFVCNIRQRQGDVLVKEGYVGERYGVFIVGNDHFTAAQSLIDGAVQYDHFAVQPFEGSDADVAHRAQLLHGNGTAEISLCQRLQQRNLLDRFPVSSCRVSGTACYESCQQCGSAFLFQIHKLLPLCYLFGLSAVFYNCFNVSFSN